MTCRHYSSATLSKELDIRIHEWPLNTVLSPNYSLGRITVNVLVCTMTLPLILALVGLFFEHNFYLEGTAVGLIEDRNILGMFIAFPVALGLVNLVCVRFTLFLSRIPQLVAPTDTHDLAIENIYATIDDIMTAKGKWKIIRLVLLIGGFIFVFFNAYNRYYRYSEIYSFRDFWTSSNYPYTFWFTNAYTSLVWGYLSPVIGFILIRIITAIYQINKKLIRGSGFNLRPMSPDGMGGLRPLADLALGMCYITIPFQIQAIIYYYWIPKVNIPFIIGMCTVIILSALMFGLPIFITHKAMVDAKRRMLEPLSAEAEKEYKKLMTTLKTENGDVRNEQLASISERIQQLGEIYELTNKNPVWPFNMNVIGRFTAIAIVPILLLLIKKWIG